jgi:hypothetical protein
VVGVGTTHECWDCHCLPAAVHSVNLYPSCMIWHSRSSRDMICTILLQVHSSTCSLPTVTVPVTLPPPSPSSSSLPPSTPPPLTPPPHLVVPFQMGSTYFMA